MTQSDINQLTESVKELRRFSLSQLRSIALWRLIGYFLLVLALFDLVEKLVPLRLMNPAWEFQTLGVLVERVPIPLLGLVLAFYGERNWRSRWELPLLKFLSWLALLLGVAFLLLVPVGISNTVRIERQNSQRLTAQVDQQMTRIQQVEDVLERAKTPAEMEALISRLDRQGRSPNIKDSQQLEQVKEQLSDSIAKGEERMIEQAEATRSSQRLGLWKSSVKWNLGALVSGVLFIGIWRGTRWAR